LCQEKNELQIATRRGFPKGPGGRTDAAQDEPKCEKVSLSGQIKKSGNEEESTKSTGGKKPNRSLYKRKKTRDIM